MFKQVSRVYEVLVPVLIHQLEFSTKYLYLFLCEQIGVLGGLFGDPESISLPVVTFTLHLFEAPQLHVPDTFTHPLKQLDNYRFNAQAVVSGSLSRNQNLCHLLLIHG